MLDTVIHISDFWEGFIAGILTPIVLFVVVCVIAITGEE